MPPSLAMAAGWGYMRTMATDSALLSEQPPRQPPRALAPRKGPIARTVGLDAPFFADKNRAFWVSTLR